MEIHWHTKNVDEINKMLSTSEKGLTNTEAKERREKYGRNEIVIKDSAKALKILVKQFQNILVYVLLVAFIISLFIGKKIDASLIGVVIIFNVSLGFIQEYRAEKSLQALKKMLIPKTKVIRNGKLIEISSKKLVPGDIILLEEGDKVPADARIFESMNLRIDESALTGESIPINKISGIVKNVPLPERTNMAYMGTFVVSGRGKAIVVGIGLNTELGKIASLISEKELETPLQIKLYGFVKFIALFTLLIGIVIFSLALYSGETLSSSFITTLALAVAAIPEGLPTLVTATLALGTYKMSKKNAIVRKLSSIETLGSITVICADKTGTMTTNEMTTKEIFVSNKTIEITGIGFEPKGTFKHQDREIEIGKVEDLELLLRICAISNDANLIKDEEWRIIGDPTEGALIVAAAKAGLLKQELEKKYPRIAEFPFSSERQLMTTIHKDKNKRIAYVKGAPEKILSISEKMLAARKVVNIENKNKIDILKKVEEMSSKGLRVIAIAYKELSSDEKISETIERKLTFVGLVGMHDPPREGVKDAIKIAREAGIKVIMLTGDHKSTAQAIAKEIQLLEKNDIILTGDELDKLDEFELIDQIEAVKVFARVTPRHKLRIVNALKKNGHIVAVTGDGVNDAPALKEANVGVSMGIKGTEVAKEASQIVLKDDNFTTIVSAIEEGRGIFDNIRKFIRYLLTINMSELFFVSLTSLARLPLPLLPVQILFLNLITDSPGLAFAVDPKDKDIMKRKPRNPKLGILDGMKVFLIAAGCLALLTELSIFVWELYKGSSIEKARTMAFTVAIMFQLFFSFNCRSESKSILQSSPFSNKYLLLGIMIAFLAQLSVLYFPPLQGIFQTVPLTLYDWLAIFLLSSTGLLVSPKHFMA